MLFVPPSIPFMVPEAEASNHQTTPPTLAATANLNSTSTTGRTLHVTGNLHIAESAKYAEFTIEKGGVVQDMYASTNSNKEWQDPDNGKYCPGFQYSGQMNWHDPHLCIYNGGTLDMEIPVDWVSGTYDIVWNTFCNDSSSVPWDPCFTESSTSFSVPALPDTTNPVVTVPSNQNFSTTNSTGVMYYISTEGPWAANPPTITATDDVGWSGTSQQVIGLYQADQLSCIRSDGIALSGQPAMYHYTVGTTTVTCTATDAAGNTGTANFTVTVTILPPPDTTPPVVTINYATAPTNNVPENQVLTTSNSTGYEFFFVASSSDTSTYVWCDHSDSVLLQSNTSPYQIVYYGVLFPVGTNTVTCTSTDSAGNVGTTSFTVTVILEGAADTTPLTINSLGVHEDGDQTKFHVTGDAPSDTTLEYFAINPSGTVSFHDVIMYPSYANPPPYPSSYDHNPFLYMDTPTSELEHGIWTMKVCTAWDSSYGISQEEFTIMCVEQNFTISNPNVDTTPPTLAATANLNSTSTTGRTLHVTGNVVHTSTWSSSGAIADPGSKYAEFTIEKGGVVQDMYASTNSNKEWQNPDNGKYCPGFQYSGQMNWHDPHLCIYNGGTLDMEIPVDWVSGTYDIVWNTFCHDSSSVPWDPCFTESNTSFSVPALPGTEAAAAEEIVIPGWIKNNAGWWADGQIDDRAFVSGLQWLISNGIMNIPPTEQGVGSDDVIPGWIKNNAEWWADNLIDDRNFVTGLQWLITNGIMVIG